MAGVIVRPLFCGQIVVFDCWIMYSCVLWMGCRGCGGVRAGSVLWMCGAVVFCVWVACRGRDVGVWWWRRV